MIEYAALTAYLEDLRGDPSLAMLSMQMAGEALNVSRAAIEQRVKAGTLDGLKVGKTRWVRAASVMKQLDAYDAEIYRVRRYLEQVACAGEVVDYSTIMTKFGMKWTIPADRSKIGRLLGEVSRQSWKEKQILLSAIVWRKGSQSPGPGFFELAAELDERYQLAPTDAAYVSDQINANYLAYGFL